VAGLDLAKVEDFTVMVVVDARERRVVHVDRFHRIDWELQIQRIKATADRYNHALLYVDSTGAGEPIFESILRAGCAAIAYSFTAKSKAALVDNLAILLERRQIVLPRPELWPDGVEELEAYEFSISDQGNVRSGAPGGMHDDCVMALGLAMWSLQPAQQMRWGRVIGAY
jgi:hypothetical protein